jgi:hypothetical protein
VFVKIFFTTTPFLVTCPKEMGAIEDAASDKRLSPLALD